MNKITLDFYLAKSKTTINGLLVLFVLLLNTQVSWGQVNITPVRTDVSGFTAWTDTAVAGTTYVQLLQATSSTISPAMDFDSYTTETLNFKARTFGGTTAAEIILTVWISTDNGSSWTSLGTRTPANSTLNAQTAFDISGYNGSQVKIKFTVGGTSNSIGVGIDDITITGIVSASAPVINNATLTASTTVLVANASIYTVTASGTPTSFAASGLPSGLSINATTGVISGTPATGTAASSPYTVGLTATNGTGTSSTVNITLTINKANQTITFTPTLSTKVIGDTPVTLTATSTSGLTVSYATSDSGVASLSGNTLSFVGAGTATITASQAGDVDYNVATSVTQDQLVSAAPLSNQTITFGALSPVTYGGATFDLTATADSSLPVTYTSSNAAVATVSGSTVTIIGAGSTNITASQDGDSSYNAAIEVIQALTVNAIALTIPDAVAASRAYNTLFTTNITGTLTGIINSDDVTFDGTLKGTFADANVANGIAVTSNCTLAGTKAGNYTLTQPTGLTANITQASQTITFGALGNKTTSDSPFALTGTASSGLAVTYISSNEAVATVSGNTVTIVGPGSTNITASQAGDSNYAAAADVVRSLTVTGVPIAAWDFFGQSSPATFAATTFDANLVSTSNANTITRGSGATASSGGNSFRTTGFQNNGISTSNTDYFQITIQASSGKSVSLSTIDANFVGTSTFVVSPGVSSQFAYSLDGTNFTLIGSPSLTIGTPATMTQIDLTAVSALQNVASGTTITLRYYASGQTATGGWGFNSPTAGTNGLAIGGVTTLVSTTWNGTSWSNGAPTASVDAIIAGNYSVAANITAKTLTVNNNAVVTIPSGNNVTVTGAVTVTAPAALTFSNNANLIQGGTTNTNTGNVIVKRNSSPLLRLDYTLWSSPVTNAALFLKGFSPNTLDARFYTYNTTFNTGGVNGAFSLVTSPSTANFIAGKGYSIRMPDNASAVTPTAYPAEFTGVPNNGDITASLVDGGSAGLRYNLVGNPYPSPISMSTFVADNSSNIESTLYFWRKTNGSGSAYCTWVPGGGSGTFVTNNNSQAVDPSGIIQTGQGFFVEAKSGATSVSFNNTQRVTNNTGQFFKIKQVAEASKIWLNATNVKGDFSQMAITYFAEATTGVDAFDAKYFNDSPIALTSNINNGEYTIQGRPAFDPTDVVALNFKTNADGDYTIALDHFEGVFAAGQEVYLVDSKTGTETDLKAGAYTFNATSGIDNTRFSLKYQKTLRVDAPAFNENSVSVYKNNGVLYVNSGIVAMSNIKVFDIQGRLIAEQKNLKSTTAVFNNLRAKNQVLIVKITGENNNVVSKKIVN